MTSVFTCSGHVQGEGVGEGIFRTSEDIFAILISAQEMRERPLETPQHGQIAAPPGDKTEALTYWQWDMLCFLVFLKCPMVVLIGIELWGRGFVGLPPRLGTASCLSSGDHNWHQGK